MVKYLDAVGLLFVVNGLMQLFGALIIGVIYGGMGAFMGVIGLTEGEEELLIMGGGFLVAALFIGLIVLVFAALPLAAGYGVLKRKSWARLVGMIASALSLTSFPLGTIIGILGFVVLLDKEVAAEFERAKELA